MNALLGFAEGAFGVFTGYIFTSLFEENNEL